jgi:hypothetical protein
MTELGVQRLFIQRLQGAKFDKPEDVVSWLGAVQAQEYPGAKWALGLRTAGLNDDAIDISFNAGKILRTHVMRPTWHFVAPADIRWLLELTAPRVHAVNAYMYRQLEIDDSVMQHSISVLTKALEGGQFRTRAELGAALAEAGIIADRMRLGYIVHYAELEALVCSGPRRGKQFTYALLAERAPQAKSLPRDAALAELSERYFTGHGPATAQDFSWWSGLTIADAKAGIEMVKSLLEQLIIEDQTYWFSEASPASADDRERTQAYLLPTYDEYVIGYTDRSAMFEAVHDPDLKDPQALFPEGSLVFDSLILIDSQVVGTWRRTFKKGAVVIETRPLKTFDDAAYQAIREAAQRFGDFLEMQVVIDQTPF